MGYDTDRFFFKSQIKSEALVGSFDYLFRGGGDLGDHRERGSRNDCGIVDQHVGVTSAYPAYFCSGPSSRLQSLQIAAHLSSWACTK